jgi:glycerophosphoryl diester phosphodiesterase
MNSFEIVAHRGVTTEYPENTLPAFQRAIELGADAVELDVRLTKDKIPVVFHYYYLDKITSLRGPIFDYHYEDLLQAEFLWTLNGVEPLKIPTLAEVLETIGGKIGLEIEVKGPEPESAIIVGDLLRKFKNLWGRIEVTSYKIALLLEIRNQCPGITTNLLYPRSESWMNLDVVAYEAANLARQAMVRAVHLHPSQLSGEVVDYVQRSGFEIHAWDINNERAIQKIVEYNIPRICTDHFEWAADYRNRILEGTVQRT